MALAIDDAIAEQLRDELDVRRFAAARAGARELEERLQQLRVLDLAEAERRGDRSPGILRKKSQLAFRLRAGRACGAMLMALCLTSLLLLAGQTSTHSSQPVQSSGATWRVYFFSLKSFQRAAVDLNVTGAPARSRES